MKIPNALRSTYFFAFFLAISLIQPLWGASKLKTYFDRKVLEKPAAYDHLLAIGVRTFEYQDEKRQRPVTVELWYPSDAKAPLDQVNDPVWVHPEEMRDVPCVECTQKFPLIMMSHGHGGDRRERSWLADRLVRHGFIVASVDHYGNTTSTFDILTSLKFWERGRDVSFAIDQLLQEPFLTGRLDIRRIGFVGYSLGGMTGLGLAGAQVDIIERAIDQLSKKYPEIKPEMVEHLDVKEAQKSLQDSRIQAALLICPASFVYSPDSLKKVHIPVGLVIAPDDEVLPFKEHAALIIQHVVPARLKVVQREISHYAFLNRVSEAGKKLVQKHIYKDPPWCNRTVIHQEVSLFAVDFFREFLR